MQIPIVMPKIGLTMTEGKIVEWRKAAGETVAKGEILFVFETEKVTFEVEAPEAGSVARIVASIDDIVPVGEIVAYLTDGSIEQDAALAPEKAGEASGAQPVETTRADAAATPVEPAADSGSHSAAGKIRATPLARRLAKDNGIDLATVPVPRGNRLKADDVRKALETRAKAAAGTQASPSAPARADDSEGRLVKLTGMRLAIAERMLASTQQTAQAYMTMSMDASRLVEARALIAGRVEADGGVRPTITDMLLKITASAIRKHPVMNTRWTEEGILWLDRLDMGLALGLDNGLIVPVIQAVDTLSVGAIAAARSDLVARGKAGRLSPDEMRGSTFSLSSLGMFGVEEFNSILNYPEAGILAVGAIVDTPVAVDGQVVVRPVMKLTLTYDHRIIDGGKAGAFMTTLKEMVENPIMVIA